ncbi:MAG: DegT/DnrJ/EryC1/StrS aminotransferase family protein [Proteobacteria bacterium]|nr:DegT/DnrJ/EryC1/StrS aminotransferase family protein [Pseudomonadota bacterium]
MAGDRLAIEGGTPVRSAALAPWPSFDAAQVEAAAAVLRSGRVNYWTGDEGRHFERELARVAGCAHAVALANGTVALELALAALGIGAGDEVVVPSRTFLASASSVMMRGARPVFADVERESQNLSAATVEAVLTPRTRAVVAVHLAGWPVAADELLALCQRRGLFLIEDCAQAHGARYGGRPVGSLGHVAAFSFCQDKIVTTAGEGGALTTNDRELWSRAWSYKDHGKSWEAVYERQHPPGFRWLHEGPGTNWRLTELQSAVGRIGLQRLDGWVERRRAHAARLTARLAAVTALRLPTPPPEVYHAYYKYYAFLELEGLRDGWSRDRVMQAIAAEGIPCGSGSCSEIYLEQAFPPALRPSPRLPTAERLGATSLMFMVHPTLSDAEIDDTGEAIAKVLHVASAG